MGTQNQIQIISGEGENGTAEIYTGKRTMLAIKRRLTKERCKGQRWAKAIQCLYNNGADVFIDIESGQQCSGKRI